MKTLISFVVKLALIVSCYLLIGFSWTAQAAIVIPPGDTNDPVQPAENMPPDQPSLKSPQNGALVGLTPTLSIDPFCDPDSDGHAGTQYQISTSDDFSSLVFQHTSRLHLTRLNIFKLLLDPETIYYWRVRFIDYQDGTSQWSKTRSFITMSFEAVGDGNSNGVLDIQELDDQVDLDENGIPDVDQADMMGVNTTDMLNPHVVIETLSEDVQIVGAQSTEVNHLSLVVNQPGNMTGIISFKLYLADNVTTTTIAVHFTQPAPADAQWYKYDLESGWVVYPNVEFSTDRRTIYISLEDGGAGDQDSVVNGVIVDPSGLGYDLQSGAGGSSLGASAGAGASGCFIHSLHE